MPQCLKRFWRATAPVRAQTFAFPCSLLERLADAGIAFAEVNTMADLDRHPHLRRMTVDTLNGLITYPAPGPIFVGEPRFYGPVPALDGNVPSEATDTADMKATNKRDTL